jgi:hypothetical protein
MHEHQVKHRLHLPVIHGDTSPLDNMSYVGDHVLPKLALGAFDEECALHQLGEDQTNMKKMLRLAVVVDQDIVEKN